MVSNVTNDLGYDDEVVVIEELIKKLRQLDTRQAQIRVLHYLLQRAERYYADEAPVATTAF